MIENFFEWISHTFYAKVQAYSQKTLLFKFLKIFRRELKMSSNDGKIEPLEGVVQINNKIAQRENVKIVVQVKSNSWIP